MYDLDFNGNYCDVILHKTMQFLCIKQKHSHISFKNNVSSIWMFKILYTYKYHSCYKSMNFIQFLFELMKNDFRTKFV
jgi:hypothetical protein